MRRLRSGAELRAATHAGRCAGKTVALVPTMGALHDGHLALIRAARAADDLVVVSIFVNPLQFGPTEDFDAYPRDERRDLDVAEAAGADLVFAPSTEEMYPCPAEATVAVGRIGAILEGRSRPGHFDGVATVVTKLFGLSYPNHAYFGQKDAQQVAVVRRVVADLSLGVEIRVVPTVREPDGLAMSSRNTYLTTEQRGRAAVLYRALASGARAWSEGNAPAAEQMMLQELSLEPGVEPDYAAAVDPSTFGPPDPTGPALLPVAARLGRVRLIDNVVAPPSRPDEH
jgi:pantoate--beta-alanine ligase